jgi:hypothetical protein
MAHAQFEDEGEGLQIWRVAANMLNKQLRTADMGWSSSLGVWRGLTAHRKKSTMLRNDKCRREYDIKMDLSEIQLNSVEWILLAQDRDWRRTLWAG